MRANNVLGIIHAQASIGSAPELTTVRTSASVPFGGRYRMIDFPLSNMVNSGITQIGIITESNYQSLVDHVGSGKPWDLARKREGMFILPPYNTPGAVIGHETKLSSLYSISDFLKKARQEYVIIADTNIVYNLDFNDIFKFHSDKNADVTIVYKHGKLPAISDLMMFALGSDNRITEMSVAQSADIGRECNYSFNILVMRKSTLEYIVRNAIAHNGTSFERDVILANLPTLKVYGYAATGYAEMIDSLKTYYKVNMGLLKSENRKALFDPKKQIDTKVSDNVPATYGIDAVVSNSLIADGCLVEGTVENSILFRDVKIEKGAVVKNSILMQGTRVGANSNLNAVITDKNAIISPSKTLSGDETYPIYIAKSVIV